MKALIIDDAQQARKLLRLTLAEIAPDIQVAGEAENVREAIIQIRKHQPDVVFLDIEMPGKSGLHLLDELEDEVNFEIIFITAYNQYAIQAFKLSAIDYLLKPFREKELSDAIDKVRNRLQEKKSVQHLRTLSENLKSDTGKTLSIPINYGYEYVRLNDIEYIEADSSYSFVYLNDGKRIVVSKNLKYFETILTQLDNFVKVHRSFIVNLNYVKSFLKGDRGTIVLKSEKTIKLSSSHADEYIGKMSKLIRE